MDLQRFLIGLGLVILTIGIMWTILLRIGLGRLPAISCSSAVARVPGFVVGFAAGSCATAFTATKLRAAKGKRCPGDVDIW
jgi:hypothetical protein